LTSKEVRDFDDLEIYLTNKGVHYSSKKGNSQICSTGKEVCYSSDMEICSTGKEVHFSSDMEICSTGKEAH